MTMSRQRVVITEELRQALREAKARDGRSHEALAAAVGTSGPTVWAIIDGDSESSVWVEALAEILDVDLSVYLRADDVQREVLATLEAARRSGREAHFLNYVRSYTEVFGEAQALPPNSISNEDLPATRRALPAPPRSRGSSDR